MGEIYACFAVLKKQATKDRFMDKVGIVKFEYDNKKFEIYFTRKRANKYSIIHCENNNIEWEQFPVLPRITGRFYGERELLVSFASSKECVRIFVIMGKPNSIIGLDEGNFRSFYKFDENCINVMSEGRFKELSLPREL